MKPQSIVTRTYPNGLVVIVEPMANVRSAAFTCMVPAGSAYDPPSQNALANVLCDMLSRGAGERDSRTLSDALDNLGVERGETVGVSHMYLSAAMVASTLEPALKIYGDILRSPHLAEDEFEPACLSVAQTIMSNEDEPRQVLSQELKRHCFQSPFGQPSDGTQEGLQNVTHGDVVKQCHQTFRPNGTIIAIAGAVDPPSVFDWIDDILGDWPARDEVVIQVGPRGDRRGHINHDSTQTHIGIAYQAIPYNHPDYYTAWAAVGVLSGGSSSRLFTEVREKRGLCYAISASLTTLKDAGYVLCYAGTTNERAQETLDITLQELRKLGEGIAEDELDRCKAGAKSALIMQQESSRSRANSICRDWYHLGRVRELSEVRHEIESLTSKRVLDYVHTFPCTDETILTLGPTPLN